jgi:hypothetical protein
MIRNLPKGRVQEAAARIWVLVQEPSERCYPLIQDEADITRTLSWAREEETGYARSYWSGGTMKGVCCFHAEPARDYAQIIALYAWDDALAAMDAMLNSVDAACPGYTIDIGLTGENQRLGTALKKRGYRIVDDCINLRCSLTVELKSANDFELTLLENANGEFEGYAPLHDTWFPELYWNAECLRQHPGKWVVFTAGSNGETAGALLLVWGPNLAEIYGLHAPDEAISKELITAALARASREGKECREMLYMADSADETNVQAALACGFLPIGRYVGWRKQPKEQK